MKRQFLFLFALLPLMSCNSKTAEQSQSIEQSQAKAKVEEVNAVTFKKLISSGNGMVLDVRTPGEVAQGVIPEAQVIDISQAGFEDKIQNLPKDKEIYVYCAAGVRSRKAAEILVSNGFTKVYNLSGGISDWNRNGFEVVKKK